MLLQNPNFLNQRRLTAANAESLSAKNAATSLNTGKLWVATCQGSTLASRSPLTRKYKDARSESLSDNYCTTQNSSTPNCSETISLSIE